ncbi:MAG: hypothetical protein HY690_07030 [Chloroflexi bacterium]|nr:hypothetical protein [Chloroflexota bacterium]
MSVAYEELTDVAKKAPRGALEATARLLRLSHEPVVGALLARALSALAEVTTHLDRRTAGEAAGERSDFAALLRMLEDPSVLACMEEADPLADARLRWVRDRERLLHAEGRPLSVAEVADLLHVSRQAVAKARAAGRLVGVPTGRGSYLFPSWQFHERRVLPSLRQVRAALAEEDPWAFIAFVVAPNSRLGDRTPLDLLRRGEVAPVIRAATAYGQHGAA